MQDTIIDTQVIIVGAGPIGLEVAAALYRANVDYIQIEAKQIGQTIANWPANTHFYSSPERTAVAGIPVHSPDQLPLRGEDYLAYLRGVVEMLNLKVNTYERIETISRDEHGFTLRSQTLSGPKHYRCRYLVLATGDMAGPRKLEIPGADLAHVAYRLADPHQYFQRRLLVIGGKNSALEAALRTWRAGATVTISYRRSAFDQSIVKPHLYHEINMLIDKEQIAFLPETAPVHFKQGLTLLAPTREAKPISEAAPIEHPTDFVLACIGFIADMSLFETAGVKLLGEERKPDFDPDTMETNVPGLFVAGTAAGGQQKRHELFISTSHHHVDKIVKAITGSTAQQTGSINDRTYDVSFSDVKKD